MHTLDATILIADIASATSSEKAAICNADKRSVATVPVSKDMPVPKKLSAA